MKHNDVFRNLTLVTQLALVVIVPTLGLLFLGLWLDKRFGTGFLAVLGVVLGIAGGASGAYSLVKRAIPKNGEKEEEYDLMKEWKEDENASEKDDSETK